MKILILAAMTKEMNLLLPLVDNAQTVRINGREYVKGRIWHHDVTIGQCGIGKVNSALATQRMIMEEQPDLVINTGVAGGAAEDIHPLDVVVALQVAYHDVWCGPGTEYGAADGFPVRMKTALAPIEAASKSINHLRKGLICSGDKFIDSRNQIDEICSRFPDALAVDMESASILQTCTAEGVDCAILRVISDSPRSGDNFAQYVNFWEDAPKATFEALSGMLRYLN